jgi:hypothetical protein
MTETILAGEEIEEFAGHEGLAFLAIPDTILARLFEHFFMRYSPRDACYRNGEQKKVGHLQAERHDLWFLRKV